jgi:hypothetical protein
MASTSTPAWTRAQFLRAAGLGTVALLGWSDRVLAASSRLGSSALAARFQSRPDLIPPAVTLRTAGDPAGGVFFIAPFYPAGLTPTAQAGPLIVDHSGNPLWFRPMPAGKAATDFRVQAYHGKPVLTWWEGHVGPGYGQGEGVILDNTYRELQRVSAGNGYQADLHEFLITAQNTALITIYSPVPADLSSLGGPSSGSVLDSIVQEIDLTTGQVLFEWHSLGQIPLEESYALLPLSPASPYDHFHVNSIDVDTDGHLLVSSRHTYTVYKLHRRTGQILWRLGGKKSDFQLGDGAAFAWQHDARRQPDGTITMFDNGANGFPQEVEPQSRGIVLGLDMGSMKASLVREYVHPDGQLASAMGSFQLLPEGDAVVGWGVVPFFSEFSGNAKMTLDANLGAGSQSYRARRVAWTAEPTGRPSHASQSNRDGTTTIYASWNGATEVAHWEVLAGAHASALRGVHTSPRHGFETAINVRAPSEVFAVAALDRSNNVLARSEPKPHV